MTHRIAPALMPLAVPIDSVSPDPGNVRQHNDRNLATIAGSLRRFGQQKPIVIDANGATIAGAGTLVVAKSLGWTHIAVVRSDLAGSDRAAYAIEIEPRYVDVAVARWEKFTGKTATRKPQ